MCTYFSFNKVTFQLYAGIGVLRVIDYVDQNMKTCVCYLQNSIHSSRYTGTNLGLFFVREESLKYEYLSKADYKYDRRLSHGPPLYSLIKNLRNESASCFVQTILSLVSHHLSGRSMNILKLGFHLRVNFRTLIPSFNSERIRFFFIY